MRDVLKDASVSSILIAIVGLVLLLMPSLTNRIIVYGIGGVLAVYGIGRIFRYIRDLFGRTVLMADVYLPHP